MKNVIFYNTISDIGGTESFLAYLSRKYKAKDITIYFSSGNPEQIARLRQYARVKKYNGENIKCEKAFYCYDPSIIENVEAKEQIQVFHTDYYTQGLLFTPHPKITKFIAVSQTVADSFKEHYGIECEVCYNPIDLDKPRKVLHLISATRLTKEKGKERIIKLGQILNDSGIPYIWTIFTNDKKEINNPNIAYMKPRLDITNYIADADYLVQLSEEGEGYGYTPAEALCLGVPVIVTPCKAFKEIGIKDKENGFILDWDLNNVPVEEIYKGLPKFEYTPLEDNWDKLLAKGKSTYSKEKSKNYLIECIEGYWDVKKLKWIEPKEQWEVDYLRMEYLNDLGLIKVIKEI